MVRRRRQETAAAAGEPGERPAPLDGLRGLRHLARGSGRWIAVAAALALLASVLALVQPLLVKRVIDAVGTGVAVGPIIVVLVALFAGQALVDAAARFVLVRTGEGIVLDVRLGLVRHLLRLRLPTYDEHRVGDLISRTSADSAILRRVVVDGLSSAVVGTVGLLGTVGLMLWLDPVLFLVIAALVAASIGAIGWTLRRMRAASIRTQHATGEMSADLERALGAIRTVRASRAEQRETDRIAARAEAVYAGSVQQGRLEALVKPVSDVAVHGSFLVILLVGGVRVANGTSSVGELIAFMLYMTYLAGPLAAVFQAVSVVRQGAGALVRVNEVFGLPLEDAGPPARPAPVAAAPVHRDGPAPTPALEFEDVWFGYQARTPVLRGVSFAVPARGHVALIGPSGAGKSTVLALVERFYDPDRGRLLLDGTDVRTLDRDAYRARIGLVEQHCPLLYGTLRDNLTYARPDAGEADLRRVIELANLDELLARLPRGLDTEVGERGMVLSGGERQRVAIARSLLAEPRVLLLDEPSSQLDPLNELALADAIEQVRTECAMLVVAHRFSTVRAADQIMVLDGGRIVAAGGHEELLDASDYYRRLAQGRPRRPAVQPAAPVR